MAIQATLEQQIAQLARDSDLAWAQIKHMQARIDVLTAEVEILRGERHAVQAEPKRGPGRPRKSQPESGEGPVLGGHEPTP